MTIQKFRSAAKRVSAIFLCATLIGLPGYGQDDPCAKYPHFAPYNPPLSDDAGWNKEMYYSTIQTADIDGDGQDELIARGPKGILAWHYDPVGQTWISMPGLLGLSDSIQYNLPQYYSTIQFAVLPSASDELSSKQASLLVRASDGMHVYRYDTQTQNWIEIGVNAATRAFPDSGGWSAVQYYSTIQTADVYGDEVPELIGRHPSGLQVWFWNKQTSTWGNMVQTNLASDAEGYNQEQFYYPIMFARLDKKASVLLRTDSVGLQAYEFNGSAFAQTTSTVGPFASGFQEPRFYKSMRAFTDSTGAYVLSLATAGATDTEQLVLYKWNGAAFDNETYIPLSYAGWDQLSQIVTIQTVDFDGDDRAEILARGQYGVYVYQQSNTGWTNSINVLSAFGDAYGFTLPQSYWIIQPARVQVANQGSFSNRTVILGRTSHGIQTYWLLNGEWRGDIAGFPAWANGAQVAAYGYISNQLDSNSDYDIRSTYNSSLSTYKTWDGYFTTVNTMTYPGSGVPNSNPVDFEIVRKNMATELRYVATVYAWFDNNKNVTDYMYGQSANNLTAVTGAVQLSDGTKSTASVVLEWLAQIASIVGTMAGGFGASEFAAVVGELSIGLSIASTQSGGISLASTVAALSQQLTDQQNELKNVNTCRITDFVTSYGALKTLGEADIAWTKPLGNDVVFDLQVRASTGLEAWMYSVIAPAAWEIWTCEPQPQRNENPNGCPDEHLPAASIWTWDQTYHYAYLWLIDGGVPPASVLNQLFGKYEDGGIGVSLNDVYFGRNGWALNGTMSCSDESGPSCGPDAPMPAYQRCPYCPQLPGPTSYSTSLATQDELSDERSMAKGSPPDRSPIQFSLKEDSRKSRAIAAIHGLRADILATVRDRTAQARMLAPLDLVLQKLRQPGAVPEGYIDNLLRTMTLRGEFHRNSEVPSVHLNRYHAKAHTIRALVVDRTRQIQALGRPKR